MTSRLAEMQARFQQKHIQEREERLMKLYDNQQPRGLSRTMNGIAASQPGKVRQMFDERRQRAGYDKSYPLEPLRASRMPNGHAPASRGVSLDRYSTSKSSNSALHKTMVARVGSDVPLGRPVKQTMTTAYRNGSLPTQQTRRSTTNYSLNSSSRQSYRANNNINNSASMTNTSHHHHHHSNNNNNINTSHKKKPKDYAFYVASFDNSDMLDNEEFPDSGINLDDDEIVERFANLNLERAQGMQPMPMHARKDTRITLANRAEAVVASKPAKITYSTKTSTVRSDTISPTSKPHELTMKASANRPAVSSSRPAASGRETSSRPAASGREASSKPSARSGKSGPGVAREDLATCKFCTRRFTSDRIAVHESICSRTSKKKRKQYDPVKHRIAGTDMESYKRAKSGGRVVPLVLRDAAGGEPRLVRAGPDERGKTPTAKKTASTTKADWRRKHEDFIKCIRAAKMATAHIKAGGNIRDLPPPPPSSNPDYIQCPHCGRRFNQQAAERHIAACATMVHNKPKPGVSARPSYKK